MGLLSRQLWVVVHRWSGLTIAAFLTIAGLTGAIIPWHAELTLASRPSLSRAMPPTPGARPLDGPKIAARVEAQLGERVSFLPLDVPTDHVAELYLQPRPGAQDGATGVVWADPYTGAVRLRYRYAVLADGVQNIVPFLYTLHHGWALGAWGMWAFGVAALIWTLDCFVGFFLTLPVRRKPTPAGAAHGWGWWARWRPSWAVRRHARGHRLSFDLHRAGGLWLWPLLFVFAWSAVGLNLPSVQRPVMKLFGAHDAYEPPVLAKPLDHPTLDFAQARQAGDRLMLAEGRRRGFQVEREAMIGYLPAAGAYQYRAYTTLGPPGEMQTLLWLDGTTGRLLDFTPPLGNTGAEATTAWFDALHMAQVFGLPYRIFVSVFGLLVVGLSVTGVLIWMKKRAARLLGKRRNPVKTGRRSTSPLPAE